MKNKQKTIIVEGIPFVPEAVIKRMTTLEPPPAETKLPDKPKRKRKTSDHPNYVDPKRFVAEIEQFYNTEIISDYLAEALTKIANGLSFAPNFINYSYKDDMVGDAVLKMFNALKNKKFNLNACDEQGNKHNPFSYFTTIAFHAFVTRIKKEKKHRATITEYQERQFGDLIRSDELGAKNIYIGPDYEEED